MDQFSWIQIYILRQKLAFKSEIVNSLYYNNLERLINRSYSIKRKI